MGWGQRKNTVVLMSAPGRKQTLPKLKFSQLSAIC